MPLEAGDANECLCILNTLFTLRQQPVELGEGGEVAAIFSQAFCPSGAAEPGLGQAPAAGIVQGSRQRCHHPVSSPECHSSVPRGLLCGAEAQRGLGEPLPALPEACPRAGLTCSWLWGPGGNWEGGEGSRIRGTAGPPLPKPCPHAVVSSSLPSGSVCTRGRKGPQPSPVPGRRAPGQDPALPGGTALALGCGWTGVCQHSPPPAVWGAEVRAQGLSWLVVALGC